MNILEQIFSSREQVSLLRFFLFHPGESFSHEELRKRLGKRIVNRGHGINKLLRLNALDEDNRQLDNVVVYHVNTSWTLYPELRALFMKAQLLVEHDLVRRLEKAGKIKLLILTGLFVSQQTDVTDVLIVGTVNHVRVARILKAFERDLDQEVRYTILSNVEYRFRKNIGDRFLYNILESRHLVILDTVDRPKRKSTKKTKMARVRKSFLRKRKKKQNKRK